MEDKVYLLCTRAAIMASAGTYVINSSPDFYNLVHNNLWLEEHSAEFGVAHIINDWWNVSDAVKEAYNADFRNTNELEEQDLVEVCEVWQAQKTGKHICLFTHAMNTKDIIEIRDRLDLPMVVITTTLGLECEDFIRPMLKREYNPIMNDYKGLDAAWEHTYNQIIEHDAFWSEHTDFVISTPQWLNTPEVVYDMLGITDQPNMKLWTNQYKLWNDVDELEKGIVIYSRPDDYVVTLLTYFLIKNFNNVPDNDKIEFCELLMQVYKDKLYWDYETFIEAISEQTGYSLTY